MKGQLNKAGYQCLDAAFVTSGIFKGFGDFFLASDGTLFAVKVRNSDGFRDLVHRRFDDKEWTSIDTKVGIKNSGVSDCFIVAISLFSERVWRSRLLCNLKAQLCVYFWTIYLLAQGGGHTPRVLSSQLSFC